MPAMAFKQQVPRLALSVEQGTPAVPDDGLYHLVQDGSILASFKRREEALRAYRTERDRRLAATGVQQGAPLASSEVLRRQIAEAEVQEFRGGTGAKKKLRIGGRRGQR
jgi:hypothetical protein